MAQDGGNVIRLDAERPDAKLREALMEKHREAARERVAAAALRRRVEWIEQRLAALAGGDQGGPADAMRDLEILQRREAEHATRISALEAQHAALEERLEAERQAAGAEGARRLAAESQLSAARRRIEALDHRVHELTSGRLYRLGKRWWRLRQAALRRRGAAIAIGVTAVVVTAGAVVTALIVLF
jgi:chromosome segregation ATPase